MTSHVTKKLRGALTAKRDKLLCYCVRQLIKHVPAKTRTAIMIAELKQLDARGTVLVVGSSLSDAMLRAILQLRETQIAADQRAIADEQKARAQHWDNVIKLRAKK